MARKNKPKINQEHEFTFRNPFIQSCLQPKQQERLSRGDNAHQIAFERCGVIGKEEFLVGTDLGCVDNLGLGLSQIGYLTLLKA